MVVVLDGMADQADRLTALLVEHLHNLVRVFVAVAYCTAHYVLDSTV